MTGDEAPETVVDDGMPESEQVVEQGEQPPQQVISELQIIRTNRESRPSSKYPSSEYVFITDEGEPENFQEVHTHADKVSWMKAMQEEMHSLLENDTYELVELPKGIKALRNKWVYDNAIKHETSHHNMRLSFLKPSQVFHFGGQRKILLCL